MVLAESGELDPIGGGCQRRCDRAFVNHNSAESYSGARGSVAC